jgi:hypothetical protein
MRAGKFGTRSGLRNMVTPVRQPLESSHMVDGCDAFKYLTKDTTANHIHVHSTENRIRQSKGHYVAHNRALFPQPSVCVKPNSPRIHKAIEYKRHHTLV